MIPNDRLSVSVCLPGSAEPDGDPLRTVIAIRGDHDRTTCQHLADCISHAGGLDDGDVVVDLSGITFLDASTIGVIVDAHNELRARTRSLTVRAPSRPARRLLATCGLSFLVEEPAGALRSWVTVPPAARAVDAPPPQGAPAPEPTGATDGPSATRPAFAPQHRTPS